MKGIKKITDERLITRNLKNVRIVCYIQTLGIMGILVYEGITNGVNHVFGSPLWFLLIISCTVMGYLNLNIAVDNEESKDQNRQNPYWKKVLIALGVGIAISLLFIFASGNPVWSSAMIGAIFFICFLAPITYTHYLNNKRSDDDA